MAQRFVAELEGFRESLLEMASLVLEQVERAVKSWEDQDPNLAAGVVANDEVVDELCVTLEQRIFDIHLHDAPVAGDLRLLHVGLIGTIALERVGDLAVSISRLVESVNRLPAVPSIQSLIRRMSARAVDGLHQAVQAVAHGDVELGERAAREADDVRALLDQLVQAAGAEAPDDAGARVWLASAVLVGRHLERVSNNGRELGGRVRFLTTGEPFRRASHQTA
jgi:phosphate transport system protein